MTYFLPWAGRCWWGAGNQGGGGGSNLILLLSEGVVPPQAGAVLTPSNQIRSGGEVDSDPSQLPSAP